MTSNLEIRCGNSRAEATTTKCRVPDLLRQRSQFPADDSIACFCFCSSPSLSPSPSPSPSPLATPDRRCFLKPSDFNLDFSTNYLFTESLTLADDNPPQLRAAAHQYPLNRSSPPSRKKGHQSSKPEPLSAGLVPDPLSLLECRAPIEAVARHLTRATPTPKPSLSLSLSLSHYATHHHLTDYSVCDDTIYRRHLRLTTSH